MIYSTAIIQHSGQQVLFIYIIFMRQFKRQFERQFKRQFTVSGTVTVFGTVHTPQCPTQTTESRKVYSVLHSPQSPTKSTESGV
jgi:hypothetical protein